MKSRKLPHYGIECDIPGRMETAKLIQLWYRILKNHLKLGLRTANQNLKTLAMESGSTI